MRLSRRDNLLVTKYSTITHRSVGAEYKSIKKFKQIFFIVFNIKFFQKINILFTKCFLPVMFFLIHDIFYHLCLLRLTI